MRATRELLEWIWPRYQKVFAFDLMISISIIGVLCGIAFSICQDYVLRAKLTEAYLAAAGLRVALVEQLALSGEPTEIPAAGGTVTVAGFGTHLAAGEQSADIRKDEGKGAQDKGAGDKAATSGSSVGSILALGSSTRELEQAQKEAAARRDERESRSGDGGGRTSARIVDHGIEAATRIDGTDYELRMYPAVTDEDTPSVYRWLCGGRAPEGWLAQSLPSRGNIPEHLLGRDCRAGREP